MGPKSLPPTRPLAQVSGHCDTEKHCFCQLVSAFNVLLLPGQKAKLFFFFLPDVGFSYLLLRSQGCLPREVLAAANGQGQVPIFDRFVINSSAQVIEPGPESQKKQG